MLDWLTASLSGSAAHAIAPWAAWHGRCMVLAWALLLPLGALLARFYKVTPGQPWPQRLDNPLWWHGHRALQWAGVLIMSVGLALAWQQGSGASSAANAQAQAHALLGWTLFAAAWLQVASAQWRGSKGGPTDAQMRGDHYDMSKRRQRFERWHKALGWASLLGAPLAVALGLVLSDAPRWMALTLGAWWLALGLVFARLQSRGRCIDTYQAIWGPDPQHPGNQRRAIGWGVRRAEIIQQSEPPTDRHAGEQLDQPAASNSTPRLP